MYQMLKHNKCKLPQEALYMIRYHSFYPWHTGKDYHDLADDTDMSMIEWVLEFKWVHPDSKVHGDNMGPIWGRQVCYIFGANPLPEWMLTCCQLDSPGKKQWDINENAQIFYL